MRILIITAITVGSLLAQVSPAWSTNARAEKLIKQELVVGCDGFIRKDVAEATALYDRNVYEFNLTPPRYGDHENYTELIDDNRQLINSIVGTPTCLYHDMYIKVFDANFAYAHYILSYSATLKSGAKISMDGRGTDIFRKIAGKWMVIHEQFSVPVDLVSGKAVFKERVGDDPK
jgi:ketosteroid isomerase-like protein